jgi:hypothetical protein
MNCPLAAPLRTSCTKGTGAIAEADEEHRIETIWGSRCFRRRFDRIVQSWDTQQGDRAQRLLGVHDLRCERQGPVPPWSISERPDDHRGDDYAVGLVIDKVAHSRYANSTLIFIVEDDAQDGPDHIDAHRSIALVAGPYVKQRQLVSERYTTVSMIRTIEEILEVPAQNLHDAGVRPMIEIFDPTKKSWTYTAAPSPLLLRTQLPFEQVQPNVHHADAADPPKPLHDAVWWTEKTKDFDFTDADRNDPALFNRVLWEGTMASKPYPTARSGLDLRHDRDVLLKSAGVIE